MNENTITHILEAITEKYGGKIFSEKVYLDDFLLVIEDEKLVVKGLGLNHVSYKIPLADPDLMDRLEQTGELRRVIQSSKPPIMPW